MPALDAALAASWPLTGVRTAATTAKTAIQGRATGEVGGVSLSGAGARGALAEGTGEGAAGRVSEARRRGRTEGA